MFTTNLHGLLTLCEYVETVAPLPTVDVIAVIVVATSVTRQYPHTASIARHNEIKRRNCADTSSRALRETNTGARENQHDHV